jgi:DHA1 family tetracycline resistance protein-like MFS transporter
MIVQGGLVGPIVRRLGERRTLIVGLLLGAFGFAGQGLAPSAGLYWCAVPFVALWGLANPAAQGLMTRRVPPTEQGRLQGAVGSIRGVTDLIGPSLFTQTFAHFIAAGAPYIPGAPMLLAGVLLLVGAGVAVRAGR